MEQNLSEGDFHQLNALIAEQTVWATLSLNINKIAKENKRLIEELSRYEFTSAVSLLSSLLTHPLLQSHCIRIELLVYLSVIYCKGQKSANLNAGIRWFNLLSGTKATYGEDPAEDVFVTLVDDKIRDYKLLEGIWEGAGFYTQKIIDTVATMPDEGVFEDIKRHSTAILVIADIVCNKAGLYRYQLGSDVKHRKISISTLKGDIPSNHSVVISANELNTYGVEFEDLAPFCTDSLDIQRIPNEKPGMTVLDQKPVIRLNENQYLVALPTSISIAYRNFIFRSVKNLKLEDSFDSNLAELYASLIADTQIMGGARGTPIQWFENSSSNKIASCSVEVDKGYFISFHFLLPSIKHFKIGDFKSVFKADEAYQNTISEHIQSEINSLSKNEEFKKGLSILAGCGWGQGYQIDLNPSGNPNWYIQSVSISDLIRISHLDEMTPQYLWQIIEGYDAVQKQGVHISNVNGLINLIGWVKSNDGHFVPHADLPEGIITPETPLNIMTPTNLLRDVRAEIDMKSDCHLRRDNIDTPHRVRRLWSNPIFKSSSSKRVYASLSEIEKGRLTAVYTNKLNIWLSVTADGPSDRSFLYQIWEMFCEWLHRIGNAIEKSLNLSRDLAPHKLNIQVHDTPETIQREINPHTNFSDYIEVSYFADTSSTLIVFNEGFFASSSIAENVCETLIAKALIEICLKHITGSESQSKQIEIEKVVITNETARQFHIFKAHNFLDFVNNSLPERLVSITNINDGIAKLGIAFKTGSQSQINNVISGSKECTDFLNGVVSSLLGDLTKDLKAFDRLTTLSRLLFNLEKSNFEDSRYIKTSAAILGLHSESEQTLTAYTEQKSKFAGASITSRILIEIAICACPLEGGSTMSDIELGLLLAKASLIYRLGGLSDAIHYNALIPELFISPLGDILFKDEFGEFVVEPMLKKATGERFISESSQQKTNYSEPQFIRSVKDADSISEEFIAIWNIEIGVEIDEIRRLIDKLEDKGISLSMAVYRIQHDELVSLLTNGGIAEEKVMRFISLFCLEPRSRWDKPPKSYELKDIFPWRFGRRLSFAIKPILKLEKSENSSYLITPNSLRQSFAYFLSGTYKGEFEQSFYSSNEMKNIWWGKASEGHTFNSDVAKALEENGWAIREGIEVPEILNKKVEKNYGDVDVLAWNSEKSSVLIIECKDLSFARNYTEMAAMLSDYQGKEKNGEPDKLLKHLGRVNKLFVNEEELKKFTRKKDISIQSCLICSGIVPMQYAKIEALNGTFVGNIDELIEYSNSLE